MLTQKHAVVLLRRLRNSGTHRLLSSDVEATTATKKPFLSRIFGRGETSPKEEKSELQEEAERVQQLHEDLEEELLESELELKRNKSMLSHSDRQMLHNRVPLVGLRLEYKDEHRSQEFKQAMFGRYGAKESGLSPNVCWPTVTTMKEQIEYERTMYDGLSLREMIQKEQEKQANRIQEEIDREALIDRRLLEQEQEARRMRDRVAARNRVAEKEREKRDAIIKEMREEYGFDVDLSKPEFALKYEEKLKVYAKKAKEEKKRVRKESSQKLEAKNDEDGEEEVKTMEKDI